MEEVAAPKPSKRATMKELNIKIQDLTAARKEVEVLVDEALNKNELIRDDVSTWLAKSGVVLDKANEVNGEAGNGKFRWWCSCSGFPLNEQVETTIGILQGLLDERSGFGGDVSDSIGLPANRIIEKSWVEEESGLKCFMVYARGLAITWAENKRYWHWPILVETSDDVVEVAELLDVCWLDVHGKVDTSILSPETTYEVLFIVMMNDEADGFRRVPVNIRLLPENGEPEEHKELLSRKPCGEWIELKVGEFYTSPDEIEEIHFSLFEHGGHWKSGLTVKGAMVRPKK